MTPAGYTPVIFEHPQYGTLVVADMADVDNERTDDIWLAELVLCVMPDGALLAVDSSEGKLVRIKRLH